jgi:hypothetical protein
MYPLLDTATINRRAAEGRLAAAAARRARGTRAEPGRQDDRSRRGVRHAVGSSLVRAGLRLIDA